MAKELVELNLKEEKLEVQELYATCSNKGLKFVCTATKCDVLQDDDILIASGMEEDGLYRFIQKTDNSFSMVDFQYLVQAFRTPESEECNEAFLNGRWNGSEEGYCSKLRGFPCQRNRSGRISGFGAFGCL